MTVPNKFNLGAALTDLDEESEKLADITLVTGPDDPHGQQVEFSFHLKNIY